MKSVNVRLALCLSASVVGTSTCQAQSNPYRHWGVKKHASSSRSGSRSKAYSPARGSATRKQIADAMRRDVGEFAGVYVVFNFDWIKVNGKWAFAQTQPESPDGKNKYEPVSALLRRTNGLWSVVGRVVTDETAPASQQGLRPLKAKFPSAPRDIFPK